MPSHLEGKEADEAISSGQVTAEDIRSNAAVDIMAGNGALLRAVPGNLIAIAKAKAAITKLIQQMQVAQWTAITESEGRFRADMRSECQDLAGWRDGQRQSSGRGDGEQLQSKRV